MLDECGTDFIALSGIELLCYPMLALGGDGHLRCVGELRAAAGRQLYDAFVAGDHERGAALHYELHPLVDAAFAETNPVPAKWVMEQLGRAARAPRPRAARAAVRGSARAGPGAHGLQSPRGRRRARPGGAVVAPRRFEAYSQTQAREGGRHESGSGEEERTAWRTPPTANGTTTLNQDTELIERARSIRPLLEENAAWGDEHGELAPPVVDALHEGRFFSMWVPQSMGGYELSPTKSLQVIAELAYGDASTAWVLMAAGLAVGTGAAYLGDAAAEELFSGERSPVIAGQGTRPGTAVAENGGYSLSGSWQFASGIKHSAWIHTAAIVEGSDPPDYRIFCCRWSRAT